MDTINTPKAPRWFRRLAKSLKSRNALSLGFATLAIAAAVHPAFAATAGDTLGGRMQAASTDLLTGTTYIGDLFSYALALVAALASGYTFFHNRKNPNSSEHRLGYAIAGLVATGFFATLPSIVNYSSQTVSAANSKVTGQQQQLTFGQG
ncbi:hypothetical protein [Acidiphilium sp.]|uniref:hypothetical protein n=1 Tax=Acidiphilium sp. TaxID=527 RepID=UPI003D03095E